MITNISGPFTLHSSGNDNWFLYQSDMRFAKKFNMKSYIKDSSGSLYNTVLIPTNPDGLNTLNIKNIINDYVLSDFNCYITSPTSSNSSKTYILDNRESFEGLYIKASTVSSQVATASVINNTSLSTIETYSQVTEIGFVGGTMSSSPIYVSSYATASNGYINMLTLSSDSNSVIAPTGSIGTNSEGYIILTNYVVFSEGPTYSSSTYTAIKGNIDYLDYNSSNNFKDFGLTSSGSRFLTNAPNIQNIQYGEYSTLSLINNYLSSEIYIIDNLGNTYSKTLPIGLTESIRYDIPSGPANLGISTNAAWYTIQMKSGSTLYSELFKMNIKCINTRWTPMRLCWLNNLGGIDYYTFKYISDSNKKIERNNYDRNLTYASTSESRGISTYRLNNYNTYTVLSEYLTDSENDWLSELSTSKEVYWMNGTNLIPVMLTNDVYTYNVGLESFQASVSLRLSRTNRN